ncbi:DUF6361 family protein [Cellulosimicrobium sp. CpK407]|uniref:DUF6361 family protein n=1 Tax=Cellulosimicrobium sp. CpK407 TaxID=3229847 RepID=UPI003F2DAFE2
MTSSFGWLDTDHAQRRRMLEVVDLFKEQGTVDELGIGSIRDTFSDALFPGTSTLLTRLRYVLFVPWLVERSVRSTSTVDDAVRRLRADEIRLIESLLEGYRDEERGRNQGILGQTARAKLKRMPSEVYWGPLGRWHLRTWDTGVVGHLRRASALRGASRGRTETDDAGARDTLLDTGFDLAGLEPPGDLLRSTTFDLRPEEAEVLLERLRTTTHGSLLGWLLEHRGAVDLGAASVAQLPLAGVPTDLRTVVDHATRFSLAVHGASLLYNLLVAEAADLPGQVENYRERLDEWHEELVETRTLDGWDRSELWSVLTARNERIPLPTRGFTDAWLDVLLDGDRIEDSSRARDLVAARERRLKGGRARLTNRSARESWKGESGTGRLDYRWGVTLRLLGDLLPALPHSPSTIRRGQPTDTLLTAGTTA